MEKRTQENFVKEKFSMFMGAQGGICAYILVSTYLLFFYTDVVGLNVGIVSGIILASKIFDGVSDIFFGSVIDNTRSKFGACRTWLLRITVPFAISLVLLFTVPSGTGIVKYIYVFFTYNLFLTICYTIQQAALGALPLYFTRNKNGVTMIMMFQFLSISIFALIVSNFTMTWITMLGGERKAWVILAAIIGVIQIFTQLLCIFAGKERVSMDQFNGGKKENIIVLVKSMLKNKYWIQCILIDGLISSLQVAMGASAAYYARYIVGDINKVGAITASFLIPPIFAYMISGNILKKVSRKQFVIVMVIVGLIGQSIIVVGSNGLVLPLIYIGMGLKGMAYATICYTTNVMLADTVEYGYWKNGVRTQSIAMAGRGMAEKLAAGIVTALIGGILSWAGYNGMAQAQSARALSAINGVFVWLPFVFLIGVAITIVFYNLDKEYSTIMKELDERMQAKSK